GPGAVIQDLWAIGDEATQRGVFHAREVPDIPRNRGETRMGPRAHLLIGRLLPHTGKPEVMERVVSLQEQLRESHGRAPDGESARRSSSSSTPALVLSSWAGG